MASDKASVAMKLRYTKEADIYVDLGYDGSPCSYRSPWKGGFEAFCQKKCLSYIFYHDEIFSDLVELG